MKGNLHVRFLGEGAAAMPFPYPTKIKAFRFQKAVTDSVRPNVSKFVRGCADDNALNGRSETGSETKQVGSGINERRRSYARFWNER